MAAYGAQLEAGQDADAGRCDYLNDAVQATSPVQDKSAREALQTFAGGKGDVLLAYENEAIAAQQNGQDIDYVVPDQTILIENPVAVTERRRATSAGARRSSTSCTRGRAEDLRRATATAR